MKVFISLREMSLTLGVFMLGVMTAGVSSGAEPESTTYKVGDKLQIKYLGQWYDAEVIQEKSWDPTLKVKFVDKEGKEKIRGLRGLGIRPIDAPTEVEVETKAEPEASTTRDAQPMIEAAQRAMVYRDWTTKDGRVIRDSRFFGHDFTNIRFLARGNNPGKPVSVPFDSLIPADQEFLRPIPTIESFFTKSERLTNPSASNPASQPSTPDSEEQVETGQSEPQLTQSTRPPSSKPSLSRPAAATPSGIPVFGGQPIRSTKNQTGTGTHTPQIPATGGPLLAQDPAIMEHDSRARDEIKNRPHAFTFTPDSAPEKTQETSSSSSSSYGRIRIGKVIRLLVFLVTMIGAGVTWVMTRLKGEKPKRKRSGSKSSCRRNPPPVNV